MKFLLLLVAALASASNAVTTVPYQGDPAPNIGVNVNGTSVFTNHDNLKTNGQAFLLWEGHLMYETPDVNITASYVRWVSAATFSDDSTRPAYAARVLGYRLGKTLQHYIATNKQIVLDGGKPQLMSSSYSPQGNVLRVSYDLDVRRLDEPFLGRRATH